MLYEDVFGWLERVGARYVVVGGVALVLHGYERPTNDLDLVFDCAGDGAERATRALYAAGFFPTVPLGLAEVTVWRTLDARGRRVDAFARFHVPFAELLAGSARVRVGEQLVRVASVADLVRAKRLAGRPADLEDLERLLSNTRADDTDAKPAAQDTHEGDAV
ncbi:MAG TPA: hypothetical protein VGV38_06690 [Pyrinomonadaceae bacterium]|nr:hypothetical protein [Pyrinomonadaceae bacterium]